METKPTAPPDQQYPPQQVGYPPQDQPPMYSPQQAGYPPAYPPGQYQPAITQQPAPVQQTTHTTVVMNQQPVLVQRTARNWSTGLCGCFEDCGSLCMGLCCPYFLLLDVSSRMGEGCCFVCCCPGALLGLRIKLRVQENIQGSLMNDYCEVECCPLCVLCQLSRELKHVGRP